MPDKGVDLFFPWNVRLAHFEGYNTVLATWTVTIYPLSSVSPSGHPLVLVDQSFILCCCEFDAGDRLYCCSLDMKGPVSPSPRLMF